MGVFDKFLDAIKLNDDFEDDDFLDDDILDDDFDEIEEKPRKKFFDKFLRRKTLSSMRTWMILMTSQWREPQKEHLRQRQLLKL